MAERLQYVPLRVKPHHATLAEVLARHMSDDVHSVSTAEVLRRAVSIGLESLAKQYGEKFDV